MSLLNFKGRDHNHSFNLQNGSGLLRYEFNLNFKFVYKVAQLYLLWGLHSVRLSPRLSAKSSRLRLALRLWPKREASKITDKRSQHLCYPEWPVSKMADTENGRYQKLRLFWYRKTVILVIIGKGSGVKSIPIWPRILSQNSHKVNCEV